MTFLELFPILILAFLLRYLFILSSTTDQDFHIMYVKWCRRFGLSHPRIPDWVQAGRCGYPSLPHFLVSCFPASLWNVAGRMLNILYDLLAIVATYGFARWAFAHSGSTIASPPPLSLAGWAALFYATSPIMHPITARLRAIGGRTMGHFFITLYCGVIGIAVITGNDLLYLLCLPLGILTIISSVFASQVMVAFSACLSLLLLSPWPFLTAGGAILLAVAIPGLDAKEILLARLHHYNWYLKSIDLNSPIAERNRLKNLFALPSNLMHHPITAARSLFENSSFFIALYCMPSMVLLIVWAIQSPGMIPSWPFGGREGFLMAVLASGLSVFLLTSFRPLIIFGQAERYLEFAAPWISLLFVWTTVSSGRTGCLLPVLYLNLIGILLNFIFVMGQDYIKQMSMQPTRSFGDALKALEGIRDARVLTIPTKLAFLISAHFDRPDAKFCYDWMTQDGGGLRYMLEEREVYQYPKADLSYFTYKYGVNSLFIFKKALEKAKKFQIAYDLGAFERIFENEDYAVYRLKS